MSTIIGWIGSFCFTVCAIPQTVQCVKQGHAEGLSRWCLAFWVGGEVFYPIAIYMEFGWIWWMMLNYIFNLICLTIICRYSIWPRDTVA
jgi:hypothetical protein